jgi:FdhD protein
MDGLARRAEAYRAHGGIHSSAVGRGSAILLHAEDIGRHNTLDRIAGEALLKGIDLEGATLVTTGRVSSEMAAKAAFLGIALIASRTSPTDLAIRLCEEQGIALLGYVRGGRFTVYSRPEGVRLPEETAPAEGITGVILAGGSSRRMGSDKALLPHPGGRFIESIHTQLSALFRKVIVVTNAPELYGFLPCRKVPDLIPGMGALSGIHSGLVHSDTPHIFVVACDMPYLRDDLILHLAGMAGEGDVVVPEGENGLEPLHALYGKEALASIEEALRLGRTRVVAFFDSVRIRKVPREEVARFDPAFHCFRNINTPQDYFRFREESKAYATETRKRSPDRLGSDET